ncbi:hypothetical protein GTR00_16625 [Kineococcus sp. T90]|nr:hypothetical protein [Kineococcus indalonis]
MPVVPAHGPDDERVGERAGERAGALDEEEVERMLRTLAASGAPVRGLGSPRARVAVAAGGGLALTLLLVLAMTVLGLLAG